MKLLISAALVAGLVMPATAAPTRRKARPAVLPSTARLPVFEFLGQNTETPANMTMLNAVQCNAAAPGKVDCTDFNDPTIGGTRLKFISMNFYNGKFYSVFGSGGRYTFTGLLGAFTAKYGSPRLETRKWQNRAGATLDNQVAIWKFKGGDLELSSLGSRLDDVDFTFISSVNAPPAPPAKVDF